MNSDIAHACATTPSQHRTREVNKALNAFDAALKRERELAVSGYYWGTLAWAWKEEARLVGVHLRGMGVLA